MEAEQPEDTFSVVLMNQRAWRYVPGLRAEGLRGGNAGQWITMEAYEVSISGCPSF